MRIWIGPAQQLAELTQGLDGLARECGRVNTVGGAQGRKDGLTVALQGRVGRVAVGEAFLEGSDGRFYGATVGRRSILRALMKLIQRKTRFLL